MLWASLNGCQQFPLPIGLQYSRRETWRLDPDFLDSIKPLRYNSRMSKRLGKTLERELGKFVHIALSEDGVGAFAGIGKASGG